MFYMCLTIEMLLISILRSSELFYIKQLGKFFRQGNIAFRSYQDSYKGVIKTSLTF